MQFKKVVGQQQLKSRLLKGLELGRLAHTQLFLGPEGSGTLAMAIAYAQYVCCPNHTKTDSCGMCPSCVKFEKFSHPDLHFFFPNSTTNSVKKYPESKLFLNEWRDYLNKCQAYAIKTEWQSHLGVGNKQGLINVRDAKDIVSKMNSRPYEAKYRVVVIWLAERMNIEAANKLLKTLEEPPANTLIIMVAERYELIIPTVRSRAQLQKFNKIKDADIESALQSEASAQGKDADIRTLARLAEGDWGRALQLLKDSEGLTDNFVKFRQWLRLCFAPKNFTQLFKFNRDLVALGREGQKSFLNYGLGVVHNSIMANHNHLQTIKTAGEELDFTKGFAPFINAANQEEIYELFNEAIYHIERNAHAGILFTDLSLKLVRLLGKGKAEVKKQA